MRQFVVPAVLAGILSVSALSTAQAQDACQTGGTLTQAVGSVMVDKGRGFVPGVIGTSLKGGDRISVRGPGSATVDFGSNRTLMVPASTTEVIRVPGCGLLQTNAGSVNPALGIAGMLAGGGALAAIISTTTDEKRRTVFFPVSP